MIVTTSAAKGRCPLCRAPSCGCGPTSSAIQPVDLALEEDPVASGLAEYDVVLNGTPTTMQLTEEDAKRLGGKKRTTTSSAGGDKPAAKKRTAANKARRTSEDS